MFTKKNLFSTIVLFMGLFLLSCGGEKQLQKADKKKPKIKSRLILNRKSYTPADTVKLEFTVKNNDVEGKKLYLFSKRPYYFEIYDIKRNLIWRDARKDRSKGLNEFYIPALEQKVYKTAWKAVLEGGEMPKLGQYMAKAYVPASSNIKGLADSVFFNIVD